MVQEIGYRSVDDTHKGIYRTHYYSYDAKTCEGVNENGLDTVKGSGHLVAELFKSEHNKSADKACKECAEEA